MNNNNVETNKIKLAGKVASEPVLSNEKFDEKFYEFDLDVSRLSNSSDTIKCIISEKIMDDIKVGSLISIDGQIRTYNLLEGEKRRLSIFTFVRKAEVITEEELKEIKNPNEVELIAYICKKPTYRETPLGREISDLLLAVNRTYHKSDYIPAIAWGRNAKYASKLEIGGEVKVSGRLQSRKYIKKTIVDGKEVSIEKVAYELSLSNLAVIEKEK